MSQLNRNNSPNKSVKSNVSSVQNSTNLKYSSASKKKIKPKPTELPPIGVFWDIENCQVPKDRSASGVVQLIRESFFTGYREAEFLVVCDVKKENTTILQELSDAQVNLIHVASTYKNAADEKLRQAIRRFADTYKCPSAVILISSDINFAPELSDLRHRKRIHIILLHNQNVSKALILCANEHYSFNNITKNAPLQNKTQDNPKEQPVEITIYNLPKGYDVQRIKLRIKQLSDNCGGKIIRLNAEKGTASVVFKTENMGIRAQRRMNGEDVFGHRITVSYPRPCPWNNEHTPLKHYFSKNKNQHENFPIHWNGVQSDSVYNNNTLSTSTVNGPNLSSDQLFEKLNEQHRLYLASTQTTGSRNVYNPDTSSSQHTDKYNSRQLTRVDYPVGGTNKLHSQENIIRPCHLRRNSGEILNNSICSSISKPNNYFDSSSKVLNSKNTNLKQPTHLRENFFQPIKKYPNGLEHIELENSSNNNVNQSVELIVTNLDLNIDPRQMRRILFNLFRKHANFVHVTLFKQPDGSPAAAVKVASALDAQMAISQLHRQRIGHKRITISYSNTTGTNPQQLKAQVTALLQEIPGKKLPLYKFRELFGTRYLTNISMAELNRLRDVCTIIDDPNGRLIALNPDSTTSNTPSPESFLHETVYCTQHYETNDKKGWAEMKSTELPNIRIGLKVFTSRLHMLLQSHDGLLPLQSFQSCYEAIVNEPLPIDETGVPLEHLVTCVQNVGLKSGLAKQIIWCPQQFSDEINEDGSSTYSSGVFTNSQPPSTSSTISTSTNSLAKNIALFSREMVDLLRTTPYCRLAFNKFVPAYHHHFGRQCRVADYGFTKLIDLLESMPHIVQILGDGNKRTITLSHRTQIRRFIGDLLRILKGSLSREIALNEFPTVAEKILGRTWDPVHYGVCELDDLLLAVPENIVVIEQIENQTIISLPKRKRTPEEITKTQQFATQVIELLRHEPQCAMLFNKFVPAYHHYFNQQCRVADYGFTKLIELFESLPDVIKIEENSDTDRTIRLTPKESLRVLSNQITQIILHNARKNTQNLSVAIADIPTLYLNEFGFSLKPEAYECKNLEQLLAKLSNTVIVSQNMVTLIDRYSYRTLGLRIWKILMHSPNYSLLSCNLFQTYRDKYDQNYDLNQLKQIPSVIQIFSHNNETYIKLKPLYIFAAKAYQILNEHEFESMNIITFENMYCQRYGPIRPDIVNCPNVMTMINSLPDIFMLNVQEKAKHTMLSLNPQLQCLELSSSSNSTSDNERDRVENVWNYQTNDKKNLESTVQEILWPSKFYQISDTTNQRKYSPPKPDTPPSNGISEWNEFWNTPPDYYKNFTVPLPISDVNNYTENQYSLMSPARHLFPTFGEPSFGDQCHLVSPPASALPKPNLDTDLDFNDLNTTLNNSSNSSNSPSRCKRKLRIAAQFKSPISLS